MKRSTIVRIGISALLAIPVGLSTAALVHPPVASGYYQAVEDQFSSAGPGNWNPAAGPCPGLAIFAVRGTRKTSSDNSHTDGQITAVYKKVYANLGSHTRRWLDPYVAPTIFNYADIHWLNPLSGYINQASLLLTSTVNQFYNRCRRSAVLLDGYSVGAAAVKQSYLHGLNTSASDRSRTLAILMGDPIFDGRDLADDQDTAYSHSDNGILSSVTFRYPPETFPSSYASTNIRDICLPGDPICNWPSALALDPFSSFGLAYFVFHVNTHINGYVNTSATGVSSPGSSGLLKAAASWACERYLDMVGTGAVIF